MGLSYLQQSTDIARCEDMPTVRRTTLMIEIFQPISWHGAFSLDVDHYHRLQTGPGSNGFLSSGVEFDTFLTPNHSGKNWPCGVLDLFHPPVVTFLAHTSSYSIERLISGPIDIPCRLSDSSSCLDRIELPLQQAENPLRKDVLLSYRRGVTEDAFFGGHWYPLGQEEQTTAEDAAGSRDPDPARTSTPFSRPWQSR